MIKETEKTFSTVPSMRSTKAQPAFFSEGYPFAAKEETKEFPTKGIAEVSCRNSGCKFAVRAQGEGAKQLFDFIGQKGCPVCGKREVLFFRVTSL